ncbi:MAG: hypothetical protein AAGH65_09500 [Pseudomonadota bacterium]
MVYRTLLILFVALAVSACGYRQIEPAPGQGVLYVLNTVVSERSAPQLVSINGVEITKIRPAEFTWIRLSPGLYTVTVAGSSFQGQTLSSRGIELMDGQVRYLVYDEEQQERYLLEYSDAHAKRWLAGKRYIPSQFHESEG